MTRTNEGEYVIISALNLFTKLMGESYYFFSLQLNYTSTAEYIKCLLIPVHYINFGYAS